jgi:hypothetical protein
MAVLSYWHQLFNAEQCQASIHTLRWKDRPLPCPRCQSHHLGRWGTYPYCPGCQHYWGYRCKRTFHDRTATLLHQSQRPLAYGILATFLLCLACSSRRIAREVGVHICTRSRGCWWLRNAALSYEMNRQWAGTVEADALYHTAGNKGQAPGGGKKAVGRRARGRRLSPGAVARGLSSSRRRAMARCRRDRRPPTGRGKRAAGSLRTLPVAIGRCRATSTRTSILRSRNTHVGRCRKIAPSACWRCASPPSECFGVSRQAPCQGMSGSVSSCGTCVNGLRARRPS